jgi:RecB family endonuclease NucS
MNQFERPPVWKMIREAIDALGSPTTNVAIREWIQNKYPGTKSNTIGCHIIAFTVNHPSRIHYQRNTKPRLCDTDYDIFYRKERGHLEIFNPELHGMWKIVEDEDGSLQIAQADIDPPTGNNEGLSTHGFAAEDHLRDYLAKHLEEIEPGLQLYVDDDGQVGIEYQTPIGRIDILAVDQNDSFVVLELKVGKGPDAVSGQVMRYMSWIKRNMNNNCKPVRGMIIAQIISDKIRYALADVENVQLKEYELVMKFKDVPELD